MCVFFSKYKDLVFDIYKQFEKFGGKEAALEIKRKVPNYMANPNNL